MNINQVTVVGRLTRDPELKALPSGTKVANMSLATSRTYKDKDDKKVEEVEYHNIVLFGRTAEIAGEYLKKGQLAGIMGRLQTRNWEKDGVKHYRTEIVADHLQMGPKAGGGDGTVKSAVKETTGGGAPDFPEEDINPDDIPF